MKFNEEFLAKLFENVVSVKFYILAASTALLVFNKIDQSTWMTMMLTTAGFRTANELATILKASPAGKKAKPSGTAVAKK